MTGPPPRARLALRPRRPRLPDPAGRSARTARTARGARPAAPPGATKKASLATAKNSSGPRRHRGRARLSSPALDALHESLEGLRHHGGPPAPAAGRRGSSGTPSASAVGHVQHMGELVDHDVVARRGVAPGARARRASDSITGPPSIASPASTSSYSCTHAVVVDHLRGAHAPRPGGRRCRRSRRSASSPRRSTGRQACAAMATTIVVGQAQAAARR